MKKLLKWLKEQEGAEVIHQAQDTVNGVLNGERFFVDGFVATRGRSNKVIGYLVSYKGKTVDVSTQASVITILGREG